MTASSGGNSVSGSFKAVPITLGPITFNPSPIVRGQTSAGIVRLEKPAPAGGVVVSLSSNNPALTVPASVTVPTGAYAASFTAHAAYISTKVFVSVTASHRGASATTTILIYPSYLGPLTLTPYVITSGQTSAGVVRLTLAAPPGGAVVSFSSSASDIASVPASVTVPAGAYAASFAIHSGKVTGNSGASISAFYKGDSMTAILTINP